MTFTSRQSELDVLDAAFASCVAGEARTVLVEGAAGCGKSWVLDNVVERATASGCIVLTVFGHPAERDLPFSALRQLVSGARAGELRRSSVEAPDPSRVEAMQAFCTELNRLSEREPVVCCIDDVQHLDAVSLQYLQHITRHARSGRILLVIAGSIHDSTLNPRFTTELLRQPNFQRIQLHRFSPAEAAEVLAEASYPVPADLAEALCGISGGNPLLMRALLEEHRVSSDGHSAGLPQPQIGGLFTQAVTTCLSRSGPTAQALATAVAVLGDTSSVDLVAALLDLPVSIVRHGLGALDASGVLDGQCFRHAASRAAVLEGMSPAERAGLHRKAAMLLHARKGLATAVAEHLLASSAAGVPLEDAGLATQVLCEAADSLLAQDQHRRATHVLGIAHDICSDERYRHGIKIGLASATWRLNPAAAERHLNASLSAVRAKRFPAEHMRALAQLLVTQGRMADALELRDYMETERDGLSPHESPASSGEGTPGEWSPWEYHLHTMIDAGIPEIERFLHATKLAETTVAPIGHALMALMYSAQPDRSAVWSRIYLEEADRCEAPGWSALFATLHADALLRVGDLEGARAYANTALEWLPERHGSSFSFAPTAVLVRACTAMGDHAEAARHLSQSVPRELLKNMYGLGYLRARGYCHLANNQFHAALGDFLEIGQLMKRWGIDRPVMLPWRSDASEALLRMGRHQEAEQLVLQQLSSPDARHPWVRGVSLRLRAMTREPEQRHALLHEAVEELRRSGDRLEIARAMSDLGHHLQSTGDLAKGSMMVRAAWRLAKECGAGPLCDLIVPGGPTASFVSDQEPVEPERDSDIKLSESERRVATLAAQGLTNREISAKLFITVSTVEQHLTRVYRKLNINRRQDLPVDLQLHTLENTECQPVPVRRKPALAPGTQ